jgi:hypothetical protein
MSDLNAEKALRALFAQAVTVVAGKIFQAATPGSTVTFTYVNPVDGKSYTAQGRAFSVCAPPNVTAVKTQDGQWILTSASESRGEAQSTTFLRKAKPGVGGRGKVLVLYTAQNKGDPDLIDFFVGGHQPKPKKIYTAPKTLALGDRELSRYSLVGSITNRGRGRWKAGIGLWDDILTSSISFPYDNPSQYGNDPIWCKTNARIVSIEQTGVKSTITFPDNFPLLADGSVNTIFDLGILWKGHGFWQQRNLVTDGLYAVAFSTGNYNAIRVSPTGGVVGAVVSTGGDGTAIVSDTYNVSRQNFYIWQNEKHFLGTATTDYSYLYDSTSIMPYRTDITTILNRASRHTLFPGVRDGGSNYSSFESYNYQIPDLTRTSRTSSGQFEDSTVIDADSGSMLFIQQLPWSTSNGDNNFNLTFAAWRLMFSSPSTGEVEISPSFGHSPITDPFYFLWNNRFSNLVGSKVFQIKSGLEAPGYLWQDGKAYFAKNTQEIEIVSVDLLTKKKETFRSKVYKIPNDRIRIMAVSYHPD